MFTTIYQNVEYCFFDDHLTVEGVPLRYSAMTNIKHRNGDLPAFVFDYGDARMTIPHDPRDLTHILPYFLKAEKMTEETMVAGGVSQSHAEAEMPTVLTEAGTHEGTAEERSLDVVETEVPQVEPVVSQPAVEAPAEPAETEQAAYAPEEPVVSQPAAEAVEEPVEPQPAVEAPEEPAEPQPAIEAVEEPAETPAEETQVEAPAEPAETEPAVEEVEEPAEPQPAVEAVEEPAETPAEETQVEAPAEPAEPQPAAEAPEEPAEPQRLSIGQRIGALPRKTLIIAAIIAALVVGGIIAFAVVGTGESVDGINERVRPKTVQAKGEGKWKMVVIEQDSNDPSEFVVDYYKKCFKEGDDIHWIINKKTNETVMISDKDGTVLICVFEHMAREENEPEWLGRGRLLSTWIIYPETDKVERIS